MIRRLLARPFRPLVELPFFRRVAFHARRISEEMDVHFFRTLFLSLLVIVVMSSSRGRPRRGGQALDRGVGRHGLLVRHHGDRLRRLQLRRRAPAASSSARLLAFFGVAIVAALTAAVVGFVIDFLLKEGQGMGAIGLPATTSSSAGGTPRPGSWSTSSRVTSSPRRSCCCTTAEHNPAGAGVYFVRGDVDQRESDLERAGIERGGVGDRVPAGRHRRGRHALDPRRSWRSRASPRTSARSSRSTTPSTSTIRARQGQRDPGDLPAGVAAAGPLRALPRHGRARHRHRLRWRGLRALPRGGAGGLPRP